MTPRPKISRRPERLQNPREFRRQHRRGLGVGVGAGPGPGVNVTEDLLQKAHLEAATEMKREKTKSRRTSRGYIFKERFCEGSREKVTENN